MYQENLVGTFCGDRKSPYEITRELQAQKIIETHINDPIFEFCKNLIDPYGYDLLVTVNKRPTGYVEVETSEEIWINEWPYNKWYNYSFCARKIYEFDYSNEQFFYPYRLKKNAENTIYIVFNKLMTDCYAQSIKYIGENYKMIVYENKWGENADIRLKTFLRTSIRNTDMVYRGIDNCCSFINDFFRNK